MDKLIYSVGALSLGACDIDPWKFGVIAFLIGLAIIVPHAAAIIVALRAPLPQSPKLTTKAKSKPI